MDKEIGFEDELLDILNRLYLREITIASVHSIVLSRFEQQKVEATEEKRLAIAAIINQMKLEQGEIGHE